MSEPDKYEQDAAKMLPCKCEDHHRVGSTICPASYCPAVAARLRADGNVIAELGAYRDKIGPELIEATDKIAELEDEIERLRADVDYSNESGWYALVSYERDSRRRREVELTAKVEELRTVNQQIWAALTPEKRHELNLKL